MTQGPKPGAGRETPEEEAAKGWMIPAKLLAIDGAEPQDGDDVEFTVRGKFQGGRVLPEMVNDQALPAPMAEETPAEEEEEGLMSMRAKALREAEENDKLPS